MYCNNCNTQYNTNDNFCANCGCALSSPHYQAKSAINKPKNSAMILGIISLSYPCASFVIWAMSLFLTLSSDRSISLAANWIAGNIFKLGIISCGIGIIAAILGFKNKKVIPIVLGIIGGLFSITVFGMSMLE